VANTSGVTNSAVMSELLAHGHEFSFAQVMRLARMFLDPRGEEGLPEVPWQDRVRIRPELSMAFPASDVARVESDGSNLRITATFLELYGPASPLPNFYTEDLLDEASTDESVIRDFVDIIHQRLYHLYFQCWSKYRLFIRVTEEKNPFDRERLFCLIGLGEKELASSLPDSFSMLRYTGLLARFPRSALDLRTMLRDCLKIKRIRIVQNVMRMASIPADQQMRMGVSGCRLGVDTVLGSHIADKMGKFRIEIGPLGWGGYNEFLPGTLLYEKLVRFVRFFVTDPLAFDMKLILAADEAKPIRLGDPRARLGLNMWCFSGDTLGEVSAVFPVSFQPEKKSLSQATEPDFTSPPPMKAGHNLIDYYREERARLGDLLIQFAENHPNLSSMVSGPVADPGVEKLLEGTAFFNALLQRKLDDDVPEFIHEVIHAIQPDYLRPIPAATIVAFTPKPNCTEPQIIPEGTQLDSVPVEGTSCRFTTSFPVEVHPLVLTDASFTQPSGRAAAITLAMELRHIRLNDWQLKNLRIFLAGEYEHAADLYLLFTRHLSRIVISSDTENSKAVLDPSCLKPADLDDDGDSVSRAPVASSERFVRDYFLLPEKFLFLELQGWEKWLRRGESSQFTVRFEFDRLPFRPHKVGTDDFVLFATPALNVFPHRAEPVTFDNSCSLYPVRPSGIKSNERQVYSVKKVQGYTRFSAAAKTYYQADMLTHKTDSISTYQVIRRKSALHTGLDTFISVCDQTGSSLPSEELLYIDLLCTNGNLPENLDIGGICNQTGNSPSFATFTNCKPISGAKSDALEGNHLWRILSLCCVNPRLLTTKSLRAVLKLICSSVTKNWSVTVRNEKRISGIIGMTIVPCGRIIKGAWRQGWNVQIRLDPDCFCSQGDMWLFGAMSDQFIRGFASESFFTKISIEDVRNGVEYEWPARMGKREMI
jgi:type VI secretion system protein ImpG